MPALTGSVTMYWIRYDVTWPSTGTRQTPGSFLCLARIARHEPLAMTSAILQPRSGSARSPFHDARRRRRVALFFVSAQFTPEPKRPEVSCRNGELFRLTFCFAPESLRYRHMHTRAVYCANSEGRCRESLLHEFDCRRSEQAYE